VAGGALGIALLTRYAERVETLWTRPLAVLGALGAACGVGYAIALLLSPAPWALRVRHLAAGATAAWLALELARSTRRAGLSAASDAFKVLWAPLSEEFCKALLLALIWSRGDDRRDRSELVTAAVGVGVGFAIRENLFYFGQTLGGGTVYFEWVLLRAIPPVLAHAFFGMILGDTIAHGTLQARVASRPMKRVTLLGFAVATVAHVVYNGVALLLGRFGGTYAIEWTALWSLFAIGAALVLRQRVQHAAAADEPVSMSIVPSRDTSGTVVAGLLGTLALLWLLPVSLSRFLAAVLTPLGVAIASAHLVARALRVPRVLTAVLLGIALRPLVRAPELMVATLGAALRTPSARLPLALLAHGTWLASVALVTWWVTRARGRLAALTFAVGLGAGLVSASLGNTLSVRENPQLVREMVYSTLLHLPRTLALSALVARAAHRSLSRAALGVLVAAALATALDAFVRTVRAPWWSAASVAVASVALLAGITVEALRRQQREAPAPAPTVPVPEG
jgi:RsiW-degrading membrane proteinase PrsW (M82 family)